MAAVGQQVDHFVIERLLGSTHVTGVKLKDGTHASGTCYVELRDSKNDMRWLGAGYYNDEYVKVGEQWKFQSRSFNMIELQGQGGR